MTTEWIKISERKPVHADFPVLYWSDKFEQCEVYYDKSELRSWTHWKIFRDAPPKKETQEELDASIIQAIVEAYNNDKGLIGQRDLINLTLSHERSEIRHLIQRHRNGELPGPEVIRMISGRVKL